MSDKFTPDILEFIAEKRSLGYSPKRIGLAIKTRFGIEVSDGAVCWQCLVNGIDKPNAKPLPQTAPGPPIVTRGRHLVRKYSPKEDEEILARSNLGQGVSEIGRALGRPHNSIIGRKATLARHDARREKYATVGHDNET